MLGLKGGAVVRAIAKQASKGSISRWGRVIMVIINLHYHDFRLASVTFALPVRTTCMPSNVGWGYGYSYECEGECHRVNGGKRVRGRISDRQPNGADDCGRRVQYWHGSIGFARY